MKTVHRPGPPVMSSCHVLLWESRRSPVLPPGGLYQPEIKICVRWGASLRQEDNRNVGQCLTKEDSTGDEPVRAG